MVGGHNEKPLRARAGKEEDRLFVEEEAEAQGGSATSDAEPWKVLIVDDDESVHNITHVVLESLNFRDRSIKLLSAYSGAEAWSIVQTIPDIGLVLLDVVMESDDAGLKLVKRIRDEAGEKNMRIILRTGQPGEAPEREVIRDYDINDYKSKTELTSQKLYTATISALRSYSDMVELDRNRRSLERVVNASADVFAQRSMRDLSDTALQRLADLLGYSGDALFFGRLNCLRQGGRRRIVPLAGMGAFSGCFGKPWSDFSADTRATVQTAFIERDQEIRSGCSTIYQVSPDGHEGVVYLPDAQGECTLAPDYVQLYCSRISSGFDNAILQEHLIRREGLLERQVKHRTRSLLKINAMLTSAQRHMEQELQAASALQRTILPERFPPNKRCAGFAAMEAARKVGGDFYDIIALRHGMLGFLIADVCGKGVPAAIFMAMSRTILQSVAVMGISPADCLSEANYMLATQNAAGLFVTVFYGLLNTNTGELLFANAGHSSPLLRNADGRIRELEKVRGVVLGIEEQFEGYEQGVCQLEAGDTLLLTTDGVDEAKNVDGEMFGNNRLIEYFRRLGESKVENIVRGLFEEIRDFAGDAEQSDDITAMAVRYLASST